VDLFLYDLKTVDDVRHRQITGVSNALILDNLVALAAQHANIIVRIPVIAGLNDEAPCMDAVRRYLSKIGLARVDLLPYHEFGMDKYARLGIRLPVEGLAAPSPEYMHDVADRFAKQGFSVRIGG